MTDPVALLSEYARIDTSNPPGDCRGTTELLCGALRRNGLMPLLLPHVEHGKIHGVDERIPLAGIEEMREVTYALIERWNA